MKKPAKAQYTDNELLSILSAQRANSVGFDNDTSITSDRVRALDYYKGEYEGQVKKDMPAGDNRSSMVTTEVADAIETALPDLLEMFIGGDDVVTFRPFDEADEDAARQETDYIRHVVFGQNDGFGLFYNGFKDALMSKLGVWHFYWDGEAEYKEYETECYDYQLAELENDGVEILGYEPAGLTSSDSADMSPDGPVLLNVTCRKMVRNGSVVIEVVAPEDFTTSSSTIKLQDTGYCAMRSRSSVQDLIADGYDADKVAKLRADRGNDEVSYARDTVDENGNQSDGSVDELQEIEIVKHYIRLDVEGTGKPQIWMITTGGDEAVILGKEKRSRIEFAAITPFPMPHRFIGQSLADKTIGIQRWKTHLTRMLNDSATYSTSQRQEVSQSEIVEGITLEQLIDNQPGSPVVTKNGQGLRPIQTAPPAFDMLGAMEYVNTVGESRHGVVRNAQGLNPDTLHDTKGGAEILIAAAQKRIRLMGRLFAEGGVRDLFLGVHDLLRSNATMRDTIRLRDKWVDVNPSAWERRKDMVVDIGVGSGGRERDVAVMREAISYIGGLVQLQGGQADGPWVTKENIYALADQFFDRLGIKAPERFLTDPTTQDQQPPQEQPPGPEMLKLQADQQAKQAELQMKQAESQAKLQMSARDAQAKAALATQKAEMDTHVVRERAALDAQLSREKAEAEIRLSREKMHAEQQLARERMALEIQLEREKIQILGAANIDVGAGDVNLPANRPGGDLSQ